jgi:hypothetical protein
MTDYTTMRAAVLAIAPLIIIFIAGAAVPDHYWYDFRCWLLGVTLPALMTGAYMAYSNMKSVHEKKETRKSLAGYFFTLAFISVIVGLFVSIAGGVKAWPE